MDKLSGCKQASGDIFGGDHNIDLCVIMVGMYRIVTRVTSDIGVVDISSSVSRWYSLCIHVVTSGNFYGLIRNLVNSVPTFVR